jgi:hypothetical protein
MARMGIAILLCEGRCDQQQPAKHDAPKASALFVKLLSGTRSPSKPMNRRPPLWHPLLHPLSPITSVEVRLSAFPVPLHPELPTAKSPIRTTPRRQKWDGSRETTRNVGADRKVRPPIANLDIPRDIKETGSHSLLSTHVALVLVQATSASTTDRQDHWWLRPGGKPSEGWAVGDC